MKLLTRLSLLLVLTALSGVAHAQSWDNVKALPVDTQLHINLRQGRLICNFIAADDKSIACETRRMVFVFTVRQRLVLTRESIARIRLSRQALSTFAGAGIGAAAGVGIGAGIDATAKNKRDEGHLVAVLFGLLGTGVGASIGSHTDFLAGSTIYTAP